MEKKKAKGECIYFNRGFCRFGDACAFYHKSTSEEKPMCKVREDNAMSFFDDQTSIM